MANDVAITPGAGAAIATDDVAGRHIQLVKLVDGTEDSGERIPGDAALGLLTEVSRIAPATSATTAQVTVTTTSTQIVAANANRRTAIIQVVSGGPVYVNGGAATVNGFPIAAGGVLAYENSAALNGIVASATADVRILEEAL